MATLTSACTRPLPATAAAAAAAAGRPGRPASPTARNALVQRRRPLRPARRLATPPPTAVLSAAEPAVRPPPREAVLCRRLSSSTASSSSPATGAAPAVADASAPAPAAPAHAGAVTSLLVLVDQADAKVIVSGSMDKTVALWSLTAAEGPLCGGGAGPSSDGEPCSHPPTAQPVARLVVPAAGAAPPPADGGDGGPVDAPAAVVEDGSLVVAPPPDASSPAPPSPSSESSGAPVFALAADLEHCSARAAALASMDGGPCAAARAARPTVFIGSAGRAVAAWEPPDGRLLPGVGLGGHSGWVRALAASGRWLFSCGCGGLKQWDLSRAVPRLVGEASLGDTGDVSALGCGGGMVYAGGTDGSLRGWAVSAEGGGLPPAPTLSAPREASHAGRVTAIACPPGSRFIYTTSHDGSVRAWEAASLRPAGAVHAAHGGGRVRCACVAGDGLLYTGGDDGLVRRWAIDGGGAYDGVDGEQEPDDCAEGESMSGECWEAALLAAAGAAVAAASASSPSPSSSPLVPAPAGALYGHSHPVRALAAGPLDTLVSGDKGGEVLVWRV